MLTPLDAAARIGRDLCASAHWDRAGRLCNWMGRSAAELERVGGPITPTSAALGPDLHGGSAGVALFLAELFAQVGDPHARRTALGAIARSALRLEGHDPGAASALSFHEGPLGVAYAAARVAALTGDEAAAVTSERLLDRVLTSRKVPRPLDVIGGNAGAIPALLGLARERGRELAIALGDELCRAATTRGATWEWDPEAASGPGIGTRFLPGVAHGAAGLGLALLELHAATGRADFLAAGLGAFAHEAALFDPARGDWADLRPGIPPGTPARPPGWCHGAPGITLARLRASTLDPPRHAVHRAEARLALAVTLDALDATGAADRPDATLCHGLAGTLEALRVAGLALADETLAHAARTLAHELIARHAEAGDWPSGLASGGPNPSLMLGTAGIGHALLRLHDPGGVPPILCLTPGRADEAGGPASG